MGYNDIFPFYPSANGILGQIVIGVGIGDLADPTGEDLDDPGLGAGGYPCEAVVLGAAGNPGDSEVFDPGTISTKLYLRYWEIKTTGTVTTIPSGDSTYDVPGPQTQTMTGPHYVPIAPTTITDSTTAPVLQLWPFTTPGDGPGTLNSVDWLGLTLGGSSPHVANPVKVSGADNSPGWGLFDPVLDTTPGTGLPNFSPTLLVFPAFDGSGGWYGTCTTTSLLAGVTTTTSSSSPSLTSSYPSSQYAPLAGYTLTSQTASMRVWTKGSDSITVTLSGSKSLADIITLYAAYYAAHTGHSLTTSGPGVHSALIGQVIVIGQENLGNVWSFALAQGGGATVGPGPGYIETGVPITYNYVSTTGRLVWIGLDGSWGIDTITTPGGSGSATNGGAFSISKPGYIVVSAGQWSNPVAGNAGIGGYGPLPGAYLAFDLVMDNT